jgi:hypothetical protein
MTNLKEINCEMYRTYLFCSGQRPVAEPCEHELNLRVPIKWKISLKGDRLLACQGIASCMESAVDRNIQYCVFKV